MIEISADVYAWLISIDVLDDSIYDPKLDSNNKLNYYPEYPNLPASVANFSVNENGTISLTKPILKSILTGTFFPGLFNKLNLLMNTIYGNIYKADETLTGVINEDMPQVKLHNWNLIHESIKNYYGILFDNNFKTLLIAGDNGTFQELFRRLYSFYLELQMKIEKDLLSQGLKENTISQELQMAVFDNDKSAELPKVRFNEDIVDLDELVVGEGNEIKPLTQTRSVLEFIIVSLCKSMSMTAKQAAALLADNKKYLIHIIRKGLSKKNYGPIKEFYQLVLGHLDYFVQLIQINSIAYPNQISKNIELSLNTFRPGIISKDIEIVYISGRLLSKLALELIEKNLISAAWDWFIMPGGGLEASILCLKRFDCAVEVVVALLNNFARFHLYELFSIYLKNVLQNDGAYFGFVSDIIEKFSRLSNFTSEFNQNNLKGFFIDYITEVSKSNNINEKMKCALFLSELWCNFSIYIDTEKENYQLLSIMKQLCKDSSHLVQFISIGQLMRILTAFAAERNCFVSIIYKTLTFTFIEYHSNLRIREYIMNNSNYIFKIILSIPVGILVDPYIKQICVSLGSSYYFNINDLTFLTTIARHPRFNVKEAVLVLDVLGKVFFDVGNDKKEDESNPLRIIPYRGIFFYTTIKSLFTMILSRYLMHEIGVEFCFKYAKIILQTFCRIDKHLSDKVYLNALVLNLNPEDHRDKLVFEEDILLNKDQKKNSVNYGTLTKIIIVQMMLDILKINNTFINGVIKNLLIVAEIRHYKIYHFHNIGISKMLSHFGNPHDLVYYYNINRDELDIDTDFEIIIEIIYDKIPEFMLPPNKRIKSVEKGDSKKTVKESNLAKSNKKQGEEAQKKSVMMSLNSNQINQLKVLKDNVAQIHQKNKKIIENDYVFFHEKFSQYQKKTKPDDPRFLTLNNNPILVDLNFEEDRDIIYLNKILKDYVNFFKEVFMKYCGSIYHPVKGKVFNAVNEIGDTISPNEVCKLFKQHAIIPKILDREEILLILSLMNTRIFKKPSLKAGISFEEFKESFFQICYYAFCKPPFVYRHYSIGQYGEEMIKLFSLEFPENIKYLHPDKLVKGEQKEICKQINEELARTNFVKVPNGYQKYLDSELSYKYYVPDNMYWVLGESKTICIELLDEIIAKLLRVHTLEGFCFVKENYKVRPNKLKKDANQRRDRVIYENEKMKVLKERDAKKPVTMKRLSHQKSEVKKVDNIDDDQRNKPKKFKDILNFTGKSNK